MAEVRVRRLDVWVVDALRSQAKRHGRSLEGELRSLLSEEAMRPRLEAAERAAALREGIAEEGGQLPDSTAFIREDRETRG
jgi:antitoxin FitA